MQYLHSLLLMQLAACFEDIYIMKILINTSVTLAKEIMCLSYLPVALTMQKQELALLYY